MLKQNKFEYKHLNIVGVLGKIDILQSKFLFELGFQGSNQFIVVYADNKKNALKIVDEQLLQVANRNGVYRNNKIYDRLPEPEMSKYDYWNIFGGVGQLPNDVYIMYIVDLEEEIVYYDFITAKTKHDADIKALKEIRKFTKIFVKEFNLELDPIKDSKNRHKVHLVNSYVKVMKGLNRYCTLDKYHVGCVKLSERLLHMKTLNDWIWDL